MFYSSSGLRPFGVSILYMGWDKHYGFQLYQSDPSGNYSGWKATCIGNNSVVSCVHGELKKTPANNYVQCIVSENIHSLSQPLLEVLETSLTIILH